MRYLVRERIFGIGDDFWIEDETRQRAFFVDGKVLRLHQTFELKTPDGRIAATIRKKAISLRDTMVVEREGDRLAAVRKKLISPFRDRFTVELADGQEWAVKGNILDKEYEIEDERGKLAEISRKWFRVRDTYAVEVAPDAVDVALVLSVAVCVDALAHSDEDDEGDD
ncbi:MAG: hypothetical protein JWN52_5343 [Actinomycetia bacterium]|nr:hypothetical protein [Actinomycetes bacterium]